MTQTVTCLFSCPLGVNWLLSALAAVLPSWCPPSLPVLASYYFPLEYKPQPVRSDDDIFLLLKAQHYRLSLLTNSALPLTYYFYRYKKTTKPRPSTQRPSGKCSSFPSAVAGGAESCQPTKLHFPNITVRHYKRPVWTGAEHKVILLPCLIRFYAVMRF